MREITRQDFSGREAIGLKLRVERDREFPHDSINKTRFCGTGEHLGLIHGVMNDLRDKALIRVFTLSLDQFKTGNI